MKNNPSASTCGVVAIAARPNTKSITAYGYQWRYLKDFPIGKDILHIPENSRCAKPVDQYDLEGKYLCSFSSLKEAAEAVGSNSTSIRNCCFKRIRQAKNFQWRFSWDEEPGPIPTGKKYSNFNC